MLLSESEACRLWAEHCHHGGDVISFAHSIERAVLLCTAKVLEKKACPVEWIKAVKALIDWK